MNQVGDQLLSTSSLIIFLIDAVARSQQDKVQEARSRSGTPVSGWEPSPIAVRKQKSPVRVPTSSEPFPPPTPAQRRRASSVPLTPENLSSYLMGNESVIESELGGTRGQENSERRPIPRKIPRPASPEPPRGTGPVLILAPNSDTSGTQSQSQTYGSKPTMKREDQKRGILGAVSDHVEDGLMSEDYPWITLWEMRSMMGRIMEARRVVD